MIYDFMIGDLGLSGVSLLVFALIYSFTRSENECYGSQEYISNRVGSSITSVKNALKILLDRNLIIKRSDNRLRTKIYVVNLSFLKENVFERAENDRSETDREEGKNVTVKQTNFDYNNKEIIKTTTTSSTESEAIEDPFFIYPGEEELAMMTMDQHIDLVNRLGREVVNYYIKRLEGSLIKCPGLYLKNHYKTILAWAREDAELSK